MTSTGETWPGRARTAGQGGLPGLPSESQIMQAAAALDLEAAPSPHSRDQRPAPGVLRDAVPSTTGARRRLRALAARSWSPQAIEAETEIPAALMESVLGSYRDVSPDLVQAITAAYDQLWDRDPPTATRDQREAAEKARSLAAAKGWAPPLAWDEDQLDRSKGRPAPDWKPRKRTTRRAVDIAEDAEFIREHGGYHDASINQIAMRLGISRDRFEHAYTRARHYAARDSQAEAEVG
jgi:hypothetical protein